jgi:hypothetical protein
MSKNLILLLLLSFTASAFADEDTSTQTSSVYQFGSKSVGHNVSMTGNLLKKNELTAGTYFIGYGITEKWTIATSPFVFATYQMNNIASRWAYDLNYDNRLIFGAEYFKTFGHESESDKLEREYCEQSRAFGVPDGFDGSCKRGDYQNGFTSFQMEAWAAKIGLSRQMTSRYRLNVTGSYYKYIDDTKPFSLRMDPMNKDDYALALTTLHEFRLNQQTFLNVEAGQWGLNYKYRYWHLGSSISYHSNNKRLLASLGLSTTFNSDIPENQEKIFCGYTSRASVHPEIQFQYFL